MCAEKKYYQHIQELGPGVATKLKVGRDIKERNDILTLLDGSINGQASRMSFLRLAGFSTVLSAVLSSCEKPIHKAIPYLIKPEEITPGKSNYYASSFFDGEEFCSLLVKSRDGRPIKIEGNPLSSITRGGTSARVQASILGLYDNDRHHAPLKGDEEISWESADEDIRSRLKEIQDRGGKIVLLTSTVISPVAESIIRDFIGAYPAAGWITYDTVSCCGILLAHEQLFGVRALPTYRFDKASLIVSFDADFLGTWISPVEFTAQYAAARRLENHQGSMSRHIQYETGLSLTGSNADIRRTMKPSEEKALLVGLRNAITGGAGAASDHTPDHIVQLAGELTSNRSKCLVVSGSNDIEIQLLIGQINHALGNYGNTVDISQPVYVRKGIDSDTISLVEKMNQGEIDALLIVNTNPAYHFPDPEKFVNGLKKVSLSVSLSCAADETSSICGYVCPANHYLESWGDAQPAFDRFALQQPLINPVFNTSNGKCH